MAGALAALFAGNCDLLIPNGIPPYLAAFFNIPPDDDSFLIPRIQLPIRTTEETKNHSIVAI